MKSDGWEGGMRAQGGQTQLDRVLVWGAGGSPSRAGGRYSEGLTVSGGMLNQAGGGSVW